jgi:hypothetical protein
VTRTEPAVVDAGAPITRSAFSSSIPLIAVSTPLVSRVPSTYHDHRPVGMSNVKTS